MGVWLALVVWGGREMAVAGALGPAGIEAYVPVGRRRMVARRHCRRAETVSVPVMPGYVFACLDPGSVGALRRAERDVLGVVAADGAALVVPPSEIGRMRAAEAAGLFDEAPALEPGRRRTTLQVGQMVTVFGGPFEGWAGVIRRLTRKAGQDVAVIPLGSWDAMIPVDRLVIAA